MVVEFVDDKIAVELFLDDFHGWCALRAVRLKEAAYFEDCLASDTDTQWGCIWDIEDEEASCVLGSELVCPE